MWSRTMLTYVSTTEPKSAARACISIFMLRAHPAKYTQSDGRRGSRQSHNLFHVLSKNSLHMYTCIIRRSRCVRALITHDSARRRRRHQHRRGRECQSCVVRCVSCVRGVQVVFGRRPSHSRLTSWRLRRVEFKCRRQGERGAPNICSDLLSTT